MNNSYKKEAIAGVKWTSISSIIIAGGSFLLILFLTKMLTKSDFGIFALVNVVVGFSAEFVDIGISQAIIQKSKITSKQLSSLYWINIGLSILVFLAVYLSSGLISDFYESPKLSLLLKWISLSFLFTGLGAQFQALFQKKMLFKKMAIIDISAFIGYVIFTLLFVWKGFGVLSLVWGNLIRSALKSLLSLVLGWTLHQPKLYFNFKEVQYFLSFGSFRTGSYLVNFLSMQLDSILIGKFIGVSELGVYDVLKRLAVQPVRFLSPLIQKVTYPLLAKVHENKERVTKMFIKIINLLNLIRFPIFVGVALCAESLTNQFLGQEWASDFGLLQILTFVYLFNTIQSFVGQSMIASGKANWGLYNNLIQLPINILTIYLGSFWGIYGIAYALLIKNLLAIMPRYTFIVKKLFDISLYTYLKIIFKDLFLVLMTTVPVYLIAEYLDLKPLFDLIFRGGLFALTLIVVYLLFEKQEVKYVKSLVSKN